MVRFAADSDVASHTYAGYAGGNARQMAATGGGPLAVDHTRATVDCRRQQLLIYCK